MSESGTRSMIPYLQMTGRGKFSAHHGIELIDRIYG